MMWVHGRATLWMQLFMAWEADILITNEENEATMWARFHFGSALKTMACSPYAWLALALVCHDLPWFPAFLRRKALVSQVGLVGRG